MAKEKVIQFLGEAAKNQGLKDKLQTIKSQDELTSLAKELDFGQKKFVSVKYTLN
ncbi:Nif11-like leader peptide family natural product precursor [Crocosphaera sp.]|uniref:Nif11-like leader peptide family natural product precursor n=1 Tax=Crocosphaera sp. TaxID=2729996 RepID=UPI00257D8CBD|nr:Nif11-like leader peptide family natural product precursor [Crocosphaera sp.]NQZ61929.1 Nif11 family protein [Crocosphaera sp.]